MIEVMPAAKVLPRLKEALRTRLAQLPAGTAPPVEVTAPEEEEALRKLMVPMRTRLRNQTLSLADQRDLLPILDALVARASWRDVRYIDAFNAIYETWEAGYLPSLRRDFLARYRAVIERALS
jgi:hypothetical protein